MDVDVNNWNVTPCCTPFFISFCSVAQADQFVSQLASFLAALFVNVSRYIMDYGEVTRDFGHIVWLLPLKTAYLLL